MPLIPCTHLSHINIVVEDFYTSVQRFGELFGAAFVADIPRPEWHAGLISFSDALYEVFSPNEFLTNARYGPHYVGGEYVVSDVDSAREILRSRGIRIVRDIGMALHTDPRDTFGIAMELYTKNFHTANPEYFKPAEYWRDEHPLGLLGVRRMSAAVSDLDAAVAFYQELFATGIAYEAPRMSGVGRAVGLAMGDGFLEFMTPTGPGPLADHVQRYGDGLRATVFGVADLDRARRYFTELGVTLQDGDDEKSFMVAPHESRGVLFEFAE